MSRAELNRSRPADTVEETLAKAGAALRARRRRPGPPRAAGARRPRRPEALAVHRPTDRIPRRALAPRPYRARAPGPCRRITEQEEQRISVVAAGAAARVERALDIAAQRQTLETPCVCGGAIDVHGGEGRVPVAHCTGCGRIWTEGGVIAA